MTATRSTVHITHAALDVETLALTPDAAIMQIGVVAFTEAGDLGHLDLPIDWQHGGRRLDGPTVAWWMDARRDEPRPAMLTEPRVQLAVALMQLHHFLQAQGFNKESTIWSNGCAFDFPILNHAHAQVGRDVPWAFLQVRDARTITKLFGAFDAPDAPGVQHNAVADARWTAAVARRGLQLARRLLS